MNFPVLYRHVMAGFIDMMNRKLDKNAQLMNQLKIWKNSSDLLDLFLDIAKVINMPRVFSVYLKVGLFLQNLRFYAERLGFFSFIVVFQLQSGCFAQLQEILNFRNFKFLIFILSQFLQNTLAYLKLLLQHGMSTIEFNLARKSDDVTEFLRTLQNSTRFLHCLCCQSKV